MMKYIKDSLKYPNLAKEQNIQGNVIIQFIVNIDGKISNVKVLKGIGGGCEEEAVRIIRNMPDWKFDKNNRTIVPTYFNLPIRFTLPEDKK